jgi:hypothetical protein
MRRIFLLGVKWKSTDCLNLAWKFWWQSSQSTILSQGM